VPAWQAFHKPHHAHPPGKHMKIPLTWCAQISNRCYIYGWCGTPNKVWMPITKNSQFVSISYHYYITNWPWRTTKFWDIIPLKVWESMFPLQLHLWQNTTKRSNSHLCFKWQHNLFAQIPAGGNSEYNITAKRRRWHIEFSVSCKSKIKQRIPCFIFSYPAWLHTHITITIVCRVKSIHGHPPLSYYLSYTFEVPPSGHPILVLAHKGIVQYPWFIRQNGTYSLINLQGESLQQEEQKQQRRRRNTDLIWQLQ